jgi:hypothetical protein
VLAFAIGSQCACISLRLSHAIPRLLCGKRVNCRQLFSELSRPWCWRWLIELAHTNPSLINSIVPSHYLLAQPWWVVGEQAISHTPKDKKLFPSRKEQFCLRNHIDTVTCSVANYDCEK